MNKIRLGIIVFLIVVFLFSLKRQSFPEEVCYITVTIGSGTEQILDSDCDGIPDEACSGCTPEYSADNCPGVPNGPERGTCTAGRKIGQECRWKGECGWDGFCSKDQEDSDSDGYGDVCDYCTGKGYRDYDGDSICDGEDNCPTTPNPEQEDENGDGRGDVCSSGLEKVAPLASFKGSWYEIGRQVGLAYPEYLMEFGLIMKEVLAGYGPPDWTPQTYYEEIKDLVPQSIKDHLQGLAVGLSEIFPLSYDYAWDLVLTQNMAIELLNMSNLSSISPSPEVYPWIRGCTAFAVSTDTGTFICHNTDAQTLGYNMSTVMYWQPDNGDYAYLTIDPPGWVDVAFGLNEKGIACTMNAGMPNIDALIGLPNNFMLRRIMEQAATLEEAVDYYRNWIETGYHFGTTGAIVHLVDFNQSRIAKVQVRSTAIDVSYGEISPYGVTYIASTNHYLGDFNPEPDFYYESSSLRYDRLVYLIENTPTFDLDTCWTILSDTNGGEANKNTISCKGGLGGPSTVFGTVHTPEGLSYVLGRPDAYLAAYTVPQFVNFKKLPVVRKFIAIPGNGKVTLRWYTDPCVKDRGFNIYRSEEKGKSYMKINSWLIHPLRLSPQGLFFEYEDSAIQQKKTYYYKLEEIDKSGVSLVHGIVKTITLPLLAD